MKSKHIFYFFFPVLLLLFLSGDSWAYAEEVPSVSSGSLYADITAVTEEENSISLSFFDGSKIGTLQAAADVPCLYQGKLTAVHQIAPGSRALISYTGPKISSILILSMGKEEITSSIYGMFYHLSQGNISITVPGGDLKTYVLSPQASYYVNRNQMNASDFFRLTLPGDDIQIALNAQNEAVKIECYVTKTSIVGKTNPDLFQSDAAAP